MLKINGDSFELDGKPFKIYSGAMHYFRTLPQQWEDRLSKLAACGFNCVETYVCWNLHEPKKGVFNFEGLLDIARFLKTAKELGLYAIVRPGPYICAEWEFGGLPAWLLADDALRLRSSEPRYLAHVRDFFARLLPILAPLQLHRGGNIIAVQIENEYGSFGNDHEYLKEIEKMLRGGGLDCLLITSDGTDSNMLSGGTLPHIHKTANFGSAAGRNFAALRKMQPNGPLMCMEFWDGWFDHYGEIHHVRPARHFVASFKELLETGADFNVYMFHGGTNFGYMGGANHSGRKYQPTVTSYDYDALLTEWGGYTKKYHLTRKMLCAHRSIAPPPLPPQGSPKAYGTVSLDEYADVFSSLEGRLEPQKSVTPEYMEKFGQNYGLILYRHRLEGEYRGKLFVDGLHDRAWVFADGRHMGTLWRGDSGGVELGTLGECTIDVLVEGMGRVNYGPKLPFDRKGAAQIRIGNQLLFGWQIFPLEDFCEELQGKGSAYQKGTPGSAPCFLRGSFSAQEKADTFVQLKGFTKGFVWVNGFMLGRYWSIGPQQTLYLPAPLLKDENSITVLELEKLPTHPAVELVAKPRLHR